MKYHYRGNLLNINDKILKFEGEIKDVIKIDDHHITIRLLMDENLKTAQNIFCINDEGHIVWQIHEDSLGTKPCPYTDMFLKNNILEVGSWSGMQYYMEPLIGEILKKEFLK